jgi:hypothetical protein
LTTALFDDPRVAGEGGDYWPGREGTFVGKLTGFSEGPSFERDGKVDRTIRWMFDIYKLDGSRVQYTPEEGENAGRSLDAEKDGLSSPTISQKSKAGQWFTALLQRDIDFAREKAPDLMQEATGKRGLLVMSKNDKGRIIIKAVARFD